MPNISSIYVPSEGPESADIMFVGESPGSDEEAQLRPFIGKSGEELNHQLQKHNLQRSEVFITNLCHFRPTNNKFVNCLDTPELKEGLDELYVDIQKVNPKVIVACGAWPLFYLSNITGDKGKPGTAKITVWRGSVLPCTFVEGYKVLATIHPAFVLRRWDYRPMLNFDIGKAVRESKYRELRYPQYDAIVDPNDDELLSLVEQMKEAEYVSVDIETFGPGEMACIGFADSEKRGLCITHKKVGGFEIAQDLYEHSVPKIMQYGTYDANFLRHFYGWHVEGYYENGWDTYVAAANIMPEFPRGLDFLTSVYTDFPYYKEERKIWKQEGDMNTLWEYNIKDIIATYIIAMEQMKELGG